MLQSLRGDRPPNDRRRHPRVGLRVRVGLSATGSADPPADGWMRDVSEGGAGLLLLVHVPVGQHATLHAPGNLPIRLRCRVVHCVQVGRFFRVGVEFLEKLIPVGAAENSAAVGCRDRLETRVARLSRTVVQEAARSGVA